MNYCITLYAVGKKETTGWDGFDESVAHFTTSAEVDSIEWEETKMQAVDECWHQQKRWWLGYRLGTPKVEVGREPWDVPKATHALNPVAPFLKPAALGTNSALATP